MFVHTFSKHAAFKRFFSHNSCRLTLESPNEINKVRCSIISAIESLGFVILQQNYQPSTYTFKRVCENFGSIQNRNAIENGISYVVGNNSSKKLNSIVSNIKFFPHTDGAYLDGVTIHRNSFIRRVQPPKLLILECITQAPIGGESLIIDGKEVLHDVFSNCPQLIMPLFDRSITFFRHDQIANKVSIFEKNENKKYSIRYSYDQEMLIPNHLIKPLKFFNEEFILNKRYHTFHKLSEREIIVLDNTRILHGRNAFSGSRELRRAWIYNDISSTSLYPAEDFNEPFFSSGAVSNAISHNYGDPINRELLSKPLTLQTGIHLEKPRIREL